MRKSKIGLNFLYFLILILGLSLFFIWKKDYSAEPGLRAEISGYTLYLEIADTRVLQTKGLAGKVYLPDDYGMLFIWPQARKRIFWMKDMLVPIDIIWIRGNKIIGIENNIQPEQGVSDDQLKKYISPDLVDKVIEVRANLTKEKKFNQGDKIKFFGDENIN